ncbi:MAG: hypothetical protein WDZ37_01280 [Solirubrobacterales bacterium]
MRVRVGVAAALALLISAAALAGPGSGVASDRNTASANAEPSAFSRLMVSGHEYSLALSRSSVRRGTALIQFVNRGEDSHDLALRKRGGRSTVRFSEIRPGRVTQRRTSLSSGTYRLWCTLSGHARLGMRATLRVRR